MKYYSTKDGRMYARFVDCQKAFNTAVHLEIKIKLIRIGVGTNFYKLSKVCIH